MEKSEMIRLRVEPETKQQFKAMAAQAGMGLSEFIRQVVLPTAATPNESEVERNETSP